MNKLGLVLLVILAAVLLAACRPGVEPPPVDDAPLVDPLFREFYNFLGGEAVLGVAISPAFTSNGLTMQYTENCLMVSDPQAAPQLQFRLESIGQQLDVAEPAAEPLQGTLYVNGHNVAPEFAPLFETLGGARFVGNPLTEVHYNPHKKRYEQYFENLGMYRLEGEALDQVHLLAYGASMCNSDCRDAHILDATIDARSSSSSPFQATIEGLGQNFTGFALTEPYMAPDGMLEQVFENIVLASDRSHPEQAFLRPLPEKIGILPEPLTTPSNLPDMLFYQLEIGRGYNVPVYFLEYIRAHGDFAVFGAPMGEMAPNGEVMRQCFRNLCLAYESSGEEGKRVRPEPLGYNYKQLYYNPGSSAPFIEPTPSPSLQVLVQVWESSAMVSSQQEQEIGVMVLANATPLPGVSPMLTVMLPDGSKLTYTLPPSGPDGQTRLRLAPVSAPNGTLIPYEVCVTGQAQNYCANDSYLIWDNP